MNKIIPIIIFSLLFTIGCENFFGFNNDSGNPYANDMLLYDLEQELALSEKQLSDSRNFLTSSRDYFPDNTKEGFKTEALPSIWENKDEFNTLMQKASNDMIELAKAVDTADDLKAIQNWTPLSLACMEGRVEVANFLITHGANFNLKHGEKENTLLHLGKN